MITIRERVIEAVVTLDTTIGELLQELMKDDQGNGGISRLRMTIQGHLLGMIVVVLGSHNAEAVDGKLMEVVARWSEDGRESRAALH